MHPKVSDLKSLKSILFDKILNYDLEIENIVNEISDFIPQTKSLKLKQEY